MSSVDVERPSTAPPAVSIPHHAYFLNHDSEERAVPIGHMASLPSGGYQQIPQSERNQTVHEPVSAASIHPRLEEDHELLQQGSITTSYVWQITHIVFRCSRRPPG